MTIGYDSLVKLDLTLLKQMHPLLPATTAAEYEHRAAVGLERHGHGPGVQLPAMVDTDSHAARLHWSTDLPGGSEQLDYHRVTEDAAEAVTLALVHVACGWVVRRRLQRGEFADWLLRDPVRGHVALEVSGIDRGDEGRRLRDKLEQVRHARVAPHKAACVVELASPRATLASV